MTKFKIGDKVKVLTNYRTSVYTHGFRKGDMGEVTAIDGEEDYFVSVKKGDVFLTQILHFSELELING